MYVSRKQLERLGETIGDVSTPSKLNRIMHGGGGKSKTPKAPDYTALAKQQADSQLAAIRAQTAANRVNQNTPYGSVNYTTNGKDSYGNDMWNADIKLSPEQQQILDQQNKLSIGLGGSMNNALDYINQNLSNPLDASNLPAQQINAGQTVQDAIMSRLNPQFDRRQQQTDAQLANQGIAQGTEAYRNAQTDLGNQRNDAYINAALQGMNTGQQARQQALQEQMTLRNDPINTLSALRSGSQVQNPNFINPSQQGATSGVDYMGAGQAQFNAGLNSSNAQNAAAGNFTSGLFGLGGSLLGGAGAAGGFGNLFGGLF